MASSETQYAQLRDAVFDNDRARLQELLAHEGVDVDHYDAGGQTLLHLACFWGRMELVKVLLNAGASLKTKNAAACTALDLATHWGHSAVAEVIRLRGGRSVWEEKLGHLQVQVEDLKLQALQSQSQYLHKKRDFDTLSDDFHALHTHFEEAKSTHALSEHALAKAQLETQALTVDVARLQAALDDMTTKFHQCLVDKVRTEHMQLEAQRETQAVIAHRDEVLGRMNESIAKQESAAHNWQQAEVAAAIAESQRNFAFAERDQFQRKHTAALGELLIVTARLDATEEELMGLKTDLAEYIYEKKREEKIKKRAERTLSHVYGGGGPAAGDRSTGSSSPTSMHHRPSTTPLGKTQHQSSSRSLLLQSPSTPSSPSVHQSVATLSLVHHEPSAARGVSQQANSSSKKKYFSLAAREFGERLRAEELRKQRERVKRHERTENQYLTQGLNARVRAADQFQEEFVTKVQSFAAQRSEQWRELKKERDRQGWFTRSVLARPIATAPHALGSKDESLGKTENDRDTESQSLLVASGDAEKRRVVGTNARKSGSGGTLDYGVYRKYARPAYLDNPLRPVTSPLEVRMQSSFFAAPLAVAALGEENGDDPGSHNARQLLRRAAGDQSQESEPQDASVATPFLPMVK